MNTSKKKPFNELEADQRRMQRTSEFVKEMVPFQALTPEHEEIIFEAAVREQSQKQFESDQL